MMVVMMMKRKKILFLLYRDSYMQVIAGGQGED